MSALLIAALFVLLGAGALVSAFSVVLQRSPVSSVFSFVIHSAFLAGIYLLYGSHFLAAIQVIVYSGAILVLFLFVVMLLDTGRDTLGGAAGLRLPATLVLLLALAGVLGTVVVRALSIPGSAPKPDANIAIADALYLTYLLPFEAVTALLFAAMLGVVVYTHRGFVPHPGEDR